MKAQLLCSVCGGSFRPFTTDCPLRCNSFVYETRRARQYKRQLTLTAAFDMTPKQIAYASRRYLQYARNLYKRGRVAFVIQYHKTRERREPSVLWVVPREVA